jgi:hypothetical protein
MHTLNGVYYLCVPRDSIILILRVRQKEAAGHDRNCSSNSWPKERQIEVLAAGLQKGGGSLNKPHRKWSLTNSKLRSPKNSIRHLTISRRASPRGGFLFFLKSKTVIHPTTLRTRPRGSCVSFTSPALSDRLRSGRAVATAEGHAATRPSLTDNRP